MLTGMHYVEGGWPGSNPKDVEFFERARAELPSAAWAKVVAFGSTRRKFKTCDEDKQLESLISAGTGCVTIVAKAWDLHVDHILEVRTHGTRDSSSGVCYCCLLLYCCLGPLDTSGCKPCSLPTRAFALGGLLYPRPSSKPPSARIHPHTSCCPRLLPAALQQDPARGCFSCCALSGGDDVLAVCLSFLRGV